MRPLLEPVHERERKSNAGRKPFDVVLMFKLLILQTLYNLADEQVEYQIRDRLSFARCLGLGIEDAVPDATAVWRFRERLKELGLSDTKKTAESRKAKFRPIGRNFAFLLERGQAGTERRRRTLDGKAG